MTKPDDHNHLVAHPTNRVGSTFDDPQSARDAIEALGKAGFRPERARCAARLTSESLAEITYVTPHLGEPAVASVIRVRPDVLMLSWRNTSRQHTWRFTTLRIGRCSHPSWSQPGHPASSKASSGQRTDVCLARSSTQSAGLRVIRRLEVRDGQEDREERSRNGGPDECSFTPARSRHDRASRV